MTIPVRDSQCPLGGRMALIVVAEPTLGIQFRRHSSVRLQQHCGRVLRLSGLWFDPCT